MPPRTGPFLPEVPTLESDNSCDTIGQQLSYMQTTTVKHTDNRCCPILGSRPFSSKVGSLWERSTLITIINIPYAAFFAEVHSMLTEDL